MLANQSKSMKWWFIVLIAVTVLIAVSTQLPNTYSSFNEADIEADQECTHSMLTDFNSWIKWHFPNSEDVDSIPGAIFFGEAGKAGHEMWVPYGGDTVILVLTNASMHQVDYEMKFMHRDDLMTGNINLKQLGNNTLHISWGVEKTIGFKPLARYMNLFFDINKGESADMLRAFERLEEHCKVD